MGGAQDARGPRGGEALIARRWLALVLTGAAALRAGFALAAFAGARTLQVFHAPDSGDYLAVAREWLSTGSFAVHGVPEIIRTPGYPAFLMPGLLVGQVEIVTLALQVGVAVWTVYMVYRLGLFLSGKEPWALLGAAWYALDPLSILYTSRLLSETLFAALLTTFLLLVLRYLRERGWRTLMPAALCLGALVYVRPIAYYFAVIVVVCLLAWAAGRDRRQARIWLQAAGFGAVVALPILLWQWRNERVAAYDGFSGVDSQNLYFYNGAAVLAAREGRPYYEERAALGAESDSAYLARHPEQRTWSRGDIFRWRRSQGLRTIAASPVLYGLIHLKGVARELLDPGSAEFVKSLGRLPEGGGLLGELVDRGAWATMQDVRQRQPGLFWISLLFGAALLAGYVLAAVGAWDLVRAKRGWGVLILTASALYLVILSGGPAAYARFRHPIMPIVAVLAGCGLGRLAMRRRGAEP